jgi:agmatine deiminase
MKMIFFGFIFLLSATIKAQPVNPWTPPEYFPSKAVLLEWDYSESWPIYSELYLELIAELKSEAEVILIVNNQDEENLLTSYLNNASISLDNISFVHIPSGRIWIRDHGPFSVETDNGVEFIDFDDFATSYQSESLPTSLANLWGLESYQLNHIIFDGGNLMVDSYGNMFATDRLYSNNPAYSISYIDDLLEEYMGIKDVYTFSQMGSSDYWGHIDMQMKLLDDSTVVISSVQNGFLNHHVLENNASDFSQLTTPFGTPYRIRTIPKADNWKTYTNSLIVNNKVIIPIYDHANDDIAIAVYEELLPNHQIVGINSNSIVGWDGVIHCIAMQLFDEEQVTAIKNLSMNDMCFDVFPNPLTCGMNLNILISDEYSNSGVIRFFDINGKEVLQDIYFQTNSFYLDLDLQAGIYFVEIDSKGFKNVRKLVVLR